MEDNSAAVAGSAEGSSGFNVLCKSRHAGTERRGVGDFGTRMQILLD